MWRLHLYYIWASLGVKAQTYQLNWKLLYLSQLRKLQITRNHTLNHKLYNSLVLPWPKKKFLWISICTTLLFRRNGEENTLSKYCEILVCLSGLSRSLCLCKIINKSIILIYKLSNLLNLPFGQWSQEQNASETKYSENNLILL